MNDKQKFEQHLLDATYSCVVVYDPTMPGHTRRMGKECYMHMGRDVTDEVIATHTTILLEVYGLETTIELLKNRPAAVANDYALDYMAHYLLPRVRQQLINYESNFAGLSQYRQFRTPFRKV